MRSGWVVRGLVFAALATGLASASAADGAKSTEVWEGRLKIGTGATVRIVFNVEKEGDKAVRATFDSPDQGAKGLKVDQVTIDAKQVVFDMAEIGSKYVGVRKGKSAEGRWEQGGVVLPLTLTQVDKASADPDAIVGKEQVWEGSIEINAGLKLRVVIHVGKNAAGKLAATFDSPDQGAKGVKLDSVSLDDKVFTFELKLAKGKYEGKLNKDGTEASGTWTQAGNPMPLNLKKTDKPTALNRPQTPKPPFSYVAEDVSYPNRAGKVTIAGTLTKPSGNGPFPAVILISGSGSQDRDETLFEHKPFLVLADALTKRKVAVLRVDDRGVGGTTGDAAKSTTEDFAGDVLAGVAYLKSRPDIDAAKIGLMGHSEGGIIAPMVATKSDDVAFLVLLAGTGLPGRDILQLQGRAIGKAMSTAKDDSEVEGSLKLQKALVDAVVGEPDTAKAEAKMAAALDQWKAALSDAARKSFATSEAAIKGQFKQLNTPWFRYFLTYDPRPALAKVKVPVLALIGEKDLQVPPRENLTEITKALKTTGTGSTRVVELTGLNHLFQTSKTGAPSEYVQIEETIAPAALKEVVEWVTRVTGVN